MLKQRRMVAEQIAAALFDAEAAIDAAISKTATLTGVMPSLRRQAGASALIGQDAVERASQAIMALADARRAIVETHKELSIAQTQIGLGAVSFDPGSGDKPAPTFAEHESGVRIGRRALRSVAAYRTVSPHPAVCQIGPSASAGGLFRLNAHAYGLPPWFGLALMASVCGAAFWRGGREEQMTAGALLLSWVATIILRDPQWIGPQWGAFVADIFLLIFLVGLALRSAKYWPIFAAGFHLLAVVTHSARMIDKAMGSWAYATAAVIWAYLVIIALAVGTWNTWRSHGQPTNADDDLADSGDTRR